MDSPLSAKSKIEKSGLRLPENAVTLLRQCRTGAEVDDLIRQFRRALKEDLLHSDNNSSITVVTEDAGELMPGLAQTDKLIRGLR